MNLKLKISSEFEMNGTLAILFCTVEKNLERRKMVTALTVAWKMCLRE